MLNVFIWYIYWEKQGKISLKQIVLTKKKWEKTFFVFFEVSLEESKVVYVPEGYLQMSLILASCRYQRPFLAALEILAL